MIHRVYGKSSADRMKLHNSPIKEKYYLSNEKSERTYVRPPLFLFHSPSSSFSPPFCSPLPHHTPIIIAIICHIPSPPSPSSLPSSNQTKSNQINKHFYHVVSSVIYLSFLFVESSPCHPPPIHSFIPSSTSPSKKRNINHCP